VCKGKHTPGLKGEQLCGTYWSGNTQLYAVFEKDEFNFGFTGGSASHHRVEEQL
jgi:hypothetical protein